MALILCRNLDIGYDGKRVVQNLSFEVEDGQYLCIVGENGAGKSTLMKNLLGLNKPMGGVLQFGDGMKQNEIGYIPQQSSTHKEFPATVNEVILSGCLNKHGGFAIYNKQDRKAVAENMDRLGIRDIGNKCFRELSGGQQQRVLMARALCAARRVLFLDEPVAGLDPEATEELYKVLKRLNDEGMTILMISHDLEGVLENASHVLELRKNGTFFGRVEDYNVKHFSCGEGDEHHV